MNTALSIKEDEYPAILRDTRNAPITRAALIRNIARNADSALSARKSFVDFIEEPHSFLGTTNLEESIETGHQRVPIVDSDALLPQFSTESKSREDSFTPLQEWEGYVEEIKGDIFTARLRDLTAGSAYEEEVADFPLEDVSESDQELLKPGAIFRWAIGYQRTRGGTKRRISQIVFRRLPQWTKRELDEARKRASELAAALKGE